MSSNDVCTKKQKNKTPYIIRFLNFHRSKQNPTTIKKKYTHTSFGYPYGLYNIFGKDLINFNIAYARALKQGIPMHITEKQKEVGPLFLDIDLKTNSSERLYTNDDIDKIIKKLYDIYTKYHVMNSMSENPLIIVTEKDGPIKKEKSNEIYYKDGFHIILSKPIHVFIRCAMYEDLKQIAKEENWFQNISNNYDEIFDKSTIYRNVWMMYGSTKEKGQKYEITHIYRGNSEIDKSVYNINDRILICSARRYNNNDMLDIREEYQTLDAVTKMTENSRDFGWKCYETDDTS